MADLAKWAQSAGVSAAQVHARRFLMSQAAAGIA
jgi:hypothetical protein